MNDSTFVTYGGHTGSSTQAQRNAAYLIAEKQMTEEVGAYLLPTVVTGTYPWPYKNWEFVLPHGYVHEILSVVALAQDSACNCDLSEYDACSFIDSDMYGYVHIRLVETLFASCGCGYSIPYQFRIVDRSGLPTGTASQADVLLALTIVADINLNEMIDPSANEGTGDIGIMEFANIGYREKRVKLIRTSFGTSARAQKAAQLVKHLKRKRALRI